MPGLPRSIIKKYGVSKKAWSVFRRQKGTTRTTTKRAGVKTMKRRGAVRRFVKRRSKGLGDLGMIAGGMAYGAVREKFSALVAPITSKVPLGYTADNIVLGGISYLVAKGKIPILNKVKFLRDIGKAGLIIESAFVGQDLMRGTVATNNSAATTGRGGSFR